MTTSTMFDPSDYIGEETEQADPETDLCYAELNFEGTTVMYHGPDWPSDDVPTYHIVTWFRTGDGDTIYKNTDALSPLEVQRFLERYGPWDYTE